MTEPAGGSKEKGLQDKCLVSGMSLSQPAAAPIYAIVFLKAFNNVVIALVYKHLSAVESNFKIAISKVAGDSMIHSLEITQPRGESVSMHGLFIAKTLCCS